MGQTVWPPMSRHDSVSVIDFSYVGVTSVLLATPTSSVTHCAPSNPPKCSIHPGLKKGRTHAKKVAWLLEVPSSWSIFHLLGLNYFLNVRIYRYRCTLPEFWAVQYFKTHRFPWKDLFVQLLSVFKTCKPH